MCDINLDQFINGKGFFKRIQALSPYPFFEQMGVDDMDLHLSMFFGERIIYSKIAKLELDQVAKMVNSYHSKKWQDLILINNIGVDTGYEKIVTENTTRNNSQVGSNNLEHKVSAFNSDELLTDNLDVTNNTNKDNQEGSRSLNEKYKSLADAYNNLILAQKVNIIEQVIKDVSDYLTLSIY